MKTIFVCLLLTGCASPAALVVMDKAQEVCGSVKEVRFDKTANTERTRVVCNKETDL
jgi:hypothetical protein